MPATEITHVISQVTFPAYSKLQNNIPKLREAYLKVLQVTAFLSFPIAGLIFILAPNFTKIFLGEKWMPMVPAMQILVFAGLIRSIMATTGPIFQAVGKPKIETKWQIVRLFVIVILIYPFTVKWGIFGTSIVIFLSAFVSTVGFSYRVIKVTNCKLKEFSKIIVLPLTNGIIMVFAIIILKENFNNIGIWEFFLLAIVGVLTTIIITYFFDKFLGYKTQSLIRSSVISFEREQ